MHKHPDVGCTLVDRQRERRTPPPNHDLLHQHRQAPGTLARTHRHDRRLAETASLRDLWFAQIVQSVNREKSNDGTHETKPALLRRQCERTSLVKRQRGLSPEPPPTA